MSRRGKKRCITQEFLRELEAQEIKNRIWGIRLNNLREFVLLLAGLLTLIHQLPLH